MTNVSIQKFWMLWSHHKEGYWLKIQYTYSFTVLSEVHNTIRCYIGNIYEQFRGVYPGSDKHFCATDNERKAAGCFTEQHSVMTVKGCVYERDLHKLKITEEGCKYLKGHKDWYFCFCKKDNCNDMGKHPIRPEPSANRTNT